METTACTVSLTVQDSALARTGLNRMGTREEQLELSKEAPILIHWAEGGLIQRITISGPLWNLLVNRNSTKSVILSYCLLS